MIIFKTVSAIRNHLEKPIFQDKKIGFVPTMGALHPGHLSLIADSKQNCDITIASIFVNPTQFNDPKDYEKYPVTIDTDCRLLEEAKTDILFLPSVVEMYPQGTTTKKQYDLAELENLLEGKYRPGHFQGVCQVVERLLEIVQPSQLFMGQKDYQQCMVVQRLIELMRVNVQLNISPTLRESDGLAMSSRNLRLSEEQRLQATAIYKELTTIKEQFSTKSIHELQENATANLLQAGFSKVDYVAITDAKTLRALTDEQTADAVVALIAAFIGEVRLIDNMLLN